MAVGIAAADVEAEAFEVVMDAFECVDWNEENRAVEKCIDCLGNDFFEDLARVFEISNARSADFTGISCTIDVRRGFS